MRKTKVDNIQMPMAISKKTIENGLSNVVNNFTKGNEINSFRTMYSNERISLYTLQRDLLTNNFTNDGVFRAIIETPIRDAMNGKPKITSNQLSSEDIDVLNDYIDENDITEILTQFFVLNNLYGGSGLIIDALGQNMDSFLNVDNLKKGDIVKFFPVDRWELSNSNAKTSDRITFSWGDYYYYGHKINPDRLLILEGQFAPMLIRQQLQGWGLSIAEPLVAPSNAYKTGINVLYELMSEAKIDVFKINGFNNALQNGQDEVIIDRISLANMIKNYKSALTMDKDDDYTSKQMSFSGLSDLIRELKYEICSAVQMPATKVWGLQTQGLSSDNQDILKYNDKILNVVRPRCILYYKKILKIICKTLFDFIPNDLNIEFRELTLLSQEQIEQKKQNEFMRLKALCDSKLMTSQELAQALDEKEILHMDTKMLRGELSEFNEIQNKEEEIDLLKDKKNKLEF
jgi:phage-related protein (TIGR01555 family)